MGSMLSIARCVGSVWKVKLVLLKNSSEWSHSIRQDFDLPIVLHSTIPTSAQDACAQRTIDKQMVQYATEKSSKQKQKSPNETKLSTHMCTPTACQPPRGKRTREGDSYLLRRQILTALQNESNSKALKQRN